MKKILQIIVAILMILCMVFPSYAYFTTYADSSTYIDFSTYADFGADSICEIELISSNEECEKIDSTVTDQSRIVYIVHYFHTLEFIKDQEYRISDVNSIMLKIRYKDGSILYCTAYPYNLSSYKQFFDFISALKAGKIILPDEVTFEPSKWAKEYVEKAIESGLVPDLNQINYQGAITRLEVCQLVDSFLKHSGYAGAVEEVPFIDTRDPSVANLYQLGIIDGKSETEFDPYNFITRAEYAKILSSVYRYIHGQEQKSRQNLLYKDTDLIPDWAKEEVAMLSSYGIMKGNDKGEFEPQRDVKKEEVIVTLFKVYQLLR